VNWDRHRDAKIALEWEGGSLSYAELWQRVERVAGALPSDRLIGLHFSKSADYVIALLACWWAGSAFLPLDRNLPQVRLQAYREAARPDLEISELPEGDPQNSAFGQLALNCPTSAVGRRQADSTPASCRGQFMAQSGERLFRCAELAYIICTSGSTGTPKAVEITHAGLVPMLEDQIAAFDLGPGKRMLWLLSIQFDASLSDLGTALLSGATLVLPPAAGCLPEWLADLRITHLDIPPALLHRYQPEEFPECLETLVAGGEPSDPERLKAWARRYRLISVYGPTEATICTSLRQVDQSWDGPRLGKTLGDMEHRLHGEELLIGGSGLFRGYRQRPDLSEAACLWLEGRRYYRSGDRVEATGDGDFRFLGRLDRQVKIRGHRIELEEVENACRQLEGITRCAATVQDGELVLFYAGAREPADLRAELAERLPAWMLPTRLQPLQALPETPSGKPDVRVLRCLDSLGAMELAAQMQAQGHAVTAVQLLRGNPLGMSSREIEAQLPPDQPAWQAPGWGTNVLLTGATGQLGSRLRQRFEAAGCRVWGLSRQPGGLPGDITLPRLGLLEYDQLAETIDVVFHCAAEVNTVLPWDCLRAANLDCLPELVQFCRHGKPKALHFASTLSVFVSTDFQGRALCADRLEAACTIYGGYGQSKWAADRWLHRQSGPIFVYRYGLLVGDERDYLHRFARGLRGLGGYPEGPQVFLDMTPLDYAVEATWRLSQGPPGTYHVAAPTRVGFQELAAALDLPPLAAAEFFARTPQDGDQAAAQLALCRLHPQPDYFQRNRSLDLFQRTEVDFEISNPLDFPTLNLKDFLGR